MKPPMLEPRSATGPGGSSAAMRATSSTAPAPSAPWGGPVDPKSGVGEAVDRGQLGRLDADRAHCGHDTAVTHPGPAYPANSALAGDGALLLAGCDAHEL